jgi:hypothetical protein
MVSGLNLVAFNYALDRPLRGQYRLSLFLIKIAGNLLRSDIESLLTLQEQYRLSLFLIKIAGNLLRSDIESLRNLSLIVTHEELIRVSSFMCVRKLYKKDDLGLRERKN